MSELNSGRLKGKKRELDNSCWDGYMRSKIRKLDQQFDTMQHDKDEVNDLNNLFKNVVIFVNGYTVPSSDELKRLMKKHGGGFQHYYSRAKCTHIIATNLPDSKIRELKGEKVVHPDWILESIKAKKLLPYRTYLLYGSGMKYGEGRNLGGALKNPLNVMSKTNLSDRSHDKPGDETEFDEAVDLDLLKNCSDLETSSESSTNISTKSSEENSALGETSKEKDNLMVSECLPVSVNTSYNGKSKGNQTLPKHSVKKRYKSVPMAGDENFVNDYYSNSRLHYLSTWGAEFRDFINGLIQTTELKIPKKAPQKTNSKKRAVIMHIDMDSFFVSVALRSRPDLKGKPVAVCHAGKGNDINSDSSFGSTSEIASCSYEARALGVKNGMWLGHARQLCPGLVCVAYQFDEYRQVSQQLYEILASYTHEIQAVSCDEAFVNLTSYIEAECSTASVVAKTIRDEIEKKTNCVASAGIASNILLARMCTKVAKPNGQFHLQDDDISEFISKQKVAELPGVGFSLNQKLKSLNVVSCMDLQRIPISVLRREFGQKTGDMLFKYCRGQDDRDLKIERERKSVSAEINYAIRFTQDSEAEKFVNDLSNEVHRRLKTAGARGKQVTFKLRVRQKDAPINPVKFMGCGRCDNISRSTTLNSVTNNPSVIARECISMLRQLSVTVSDIRGMGIQISKLSDHREKTSMKTLDSFVKPAMPSNQAPSDVEKNKKLDFESRVSGQIVSETDQKNNSDDKSSKLRSTKAPQMDVSDEFKLVLSDEEADYSCDPMEETKPSSRKHEAISVASSSAGQEFPPLPVFPIFSPNGSSPSSRKSSPNRGRKKGTPRKSPAKSPGKSPGILSAQRSLHSSFQDLKSSHSVDSMLLPSPSQIDPTVFAELPEDVKKDIEISYQQRNQRLRTKASEKQSSGFANHGVACISTKNDPDRNGKNTKKPKVKHKSIKGFASRKREKDDEVPELDVSVLNALPESIRCEIQIAYEQQKRHDEKEKNKALNVNKNNLISRRKEPRQEENKTNAARVSWPKVTLAGAETLSEVKEMLKLWINDTKVLSLDEDVDVFVEYLRSLIHHKDLERLWLVLKYFRRLVADKETWMPIFNKIMDSVQDYLKQNYGGQVSINQFILT